jgi:YidC/Oxa1 family membrane protein insertase
MQSVQPEIQKVQAKYAGKTDPETKQRMQMELMKVYKDNDINMLAGCLMPFLQMPIFMAMYHAVARTPQTYSYAPNNMNFFWTMLSDKGDVFDHPLRLILPVLVVITSILQQKISMLGISEEAKNNPTMKIMMYMMPMMMFFISVTQVQALSLYWVAGNVYSTLQVLFVKRPFKKLREQKPVTKIRK